MMNDDIDLRLEQAFALASKILYQLANTPDNLQRLNYKGQEALTLLTQRHHPEFEEFWIIQHDKYNYQSVFPSKLNEWSYLHESLTDAYHYIHEKVGRVKIHIKMLDL